MTPFKLALRIRHPFIDPKVITGILELTPTYAHRVGEPRRNPRGDLLQGTNKESFWFLTCKTESYSGVSEAIETLNKWLWPKKHFLCELSDQGGSIEYFIGWFVDKNEGDTLGWKLLQECAELRVNIGLDVYGYALKQKSLQGVQDQTQHNNGSKQESKERSEPGSDL